MEAFQFTQNQGNLIGKKTSQEVPLKPDILKGTTIYSNFSIMQSPHWFYNSQSGDSRYK